ncbi:DUF6531 domain-containing protein [Sphingomonas xanthus]|uniref:DUF6531 domain-containing protein n=1 Tax=Sphingomonas xanthus TaxID=2594473 RepID=A0A516IP54_9SPHN|nr:DUF6531 domain-containing protein [Sphingomonas xanthus]QDP18698.1 hypothetical protein FMM02_01225 [Sphingomonas xanthus]
MRSASLAARIALLAIGASFVSPPLHGQQSLPPQKEYFIGEGQVDLHRGTFLYSHTDISVGPQGAPGGLEFTRYYGVREEVGPFGYGASHNFDIDLDRMAFVEEPNGPQMFSYRYTITIGRTSETFEKAYGSSDIYYTDGSGGYHVLVEHGTDGPYTYYGPDGVVINFGSLSGTGGVVTSVTSSDGTQVNFSRQSGFYLITNNHGYGLGVHYGTAGRVTKVCAVNLAAEHVATACPSNAPAATYSWGGLNSAQMLGFTDPTGQTTSYGYDSTLSSIQSPGSATPDVTLTFHPISGKVFTQTLANGATWTYHYQTEGQTWWVSERQNAWTEVTNPLGKTIRYEGFGPGGSKPSKIRDELGRETTFGFAWAGGGLVNVPARKTEPEGNETRYSYTGGWTKPTEVRQVAKPGSGLADIVTTATYSVNPSATWPNFACTNPKICDKPLTVTDARGGTTNFTYDSNHGGVLSEMKPAPTAGGPRPLKITNWAQRNAYVKDSSGSLVQATSPVWVVTSETECQTVAGGSTPVCDNTAPVRVTTLEYPSVPAINALLPRGSVVTTGGISRRTCFGYDTLGRKISETTPNANLTSCP